MSATGWATERDFAFALDNAWMDLAADRQRRGLPHVDQGSTAKPAIELNTISAASFEGAPVPDRAWLVDPLIPDRTVTLLNGDGGVGKSLVALQLGAAVAASLAWIGTFPIAGPVLYLSAEDELDEMHRRLVDITTGLGSRLSDLHDLHLTSLAERDAVLAAPDRGEQLQETPLFQALERRLYMLRPKLLVVDNSADVFARNEISRRQVRQFVGMLRSLAIRHDLAVLLSSHPSLTGLASGTSGSTAWSNSVHSRLFLDRPKGSDDAPADPDARVLRVMKANYGATGAETWLRWVRGVFRIDGETMPAGDFGRQSAESEAAFLEILARYIAQGRDVSHKPSPAYAPTVFAKEADNRGCNKRAFERAMSVLFQAGKIKVETFGPASKLRSRIVLVGSE